MTSTLRDRLAAILVPGNDDTTAYAQADAVLDELDAWTYSEIQDAIAEAADQNEVCS